MDTNDAGHAHTIVTDAFQRLLKRPPDASALAFYVPAIAEGRMSGLDLYHSIAMTDEFLASALAVRNETAVPSAQVSATFTLDGASPPAHDPRHNHVAFEDAFPRDAFDALYVRVQARTDEAMFQEYCRLHKARFRESYGLVLTLCRPGDRVLEVSTSPASSELAAATGVYFVSVDHPSLYPEFDGLPNPQIGSARHVAVDLNAEDLRTALDRAGEGLFKLVLFAEIIEHLLISPYDQVRMLASCLEPGGFLFISTPNFFSHERLRRMRANRHPLDMIPPGHSFTNGMHHVREFTMADLMTLATAQGLTVHSYSWSDCWDEPSTSSASYSTHERTNLNLIAQKPW